MNIGDYVRTINDKAVGNGIIGKIKYINEREFNGKTKKYYSVWTNNKNWFEILDNDNISKRVKSSPNIIDLIQVGDYVNGLRVEENKYGDLIYTAYTYMGGDIGVQPETYINYIKDFRIEDIKSIVTKEQYESMEYRLGDK